MINKKTLKKIRPVTTSHNIGKKYVLLSSVETDTNITQIAITKLRIGEESETHRHPTMEEYFLFRKGKAIVHIDNQDLLCETNDFIRIPTNTPHSLKAITDIEVLTIGCSIYSK